MVNLQIWMGWNSSSVRENTVRYGLTQSWGAGSLMEDGKNAVMDGGLIWDLFYFSGGELRSRWCGQMWSCFLSLLGQVQVKLSAKSSIKLLRANPAYLSLQQIATQFQVFAIDENHLTFSSDSCVSCDFYISNKWLNIKAVNHTKPVCLFVFINYFQVSSQVMSHSSQSTALHSCDSICKSEVYINTLPLMSRAP